MNVANKVLQLKKEIYALKSRNCSTCKHLNDKHVETECTLHNIKYPELKIESCGKWEKKWYEDEK